MTTITSSATARRAVHPPMTTPACPVTHAEPQILLVDDHTVVREALAQVLLAAFPGARVAHAASGFEALQHLRARRPDVVVTDLTMPEMNGLQLTQRLCREHPGLGVVVLSMHDEHHYALRAYRAGARAYLSKDEPGARLVDAVRQVLAGGSYVTPEVAELLTRRMAMAPAREADRREGLLERLSDEEIELLRRLSAGEASADIAAAMHRSPKTVARYKTAMLDKLGLPSTAALIRFGIEQGLDAGRVARAQPVAPTTSAGPGGD